MSADTNQKKFEVQEIKGWKWVTLRRNQRSMASAVKESSKDNQFWI